MNTAQRLYEEHNAKNNIQRPGQDTKIALQVMPEQVDPSFLEFLVQVLRQGSLNPEPPMPQAPSPLEQQFRTPIINELRRPSKTMGIRG